MLALNLNIIGNVARGGGSIYVPIPDEGILGDSSILTYASDGSIANATGGDTRTKILSGNWTRVRANAIIGTSESYRRIINENLIEIGGVNGNASFDIATSNSNYFELVGKSPLEPLYFVKGGVSPLAAIQINAHASGVNARFKNIVNHTQGGFGYFANSDGTLSGGDANTPPVSSNKYGKIELYFVRSFGAVDAVNGRENYYIGRTTTTSGAIYEEFIAEHILGYGSDWDNIQKAWIRDFRLSNSTFVTSGTDDSEAQDASLQIANSKGIVENCIFADAPQAARISTYDLVIRNCYFQWTGDELEDAMQIISYANYADGARLVPQPGNRIILVENCDFVSPNWTGELFQVFDSKVTIVVRNCRINGATSLFADVRGGTVTGELIDGGGNIFGATIETPTFSNFTPTDFNGHGLLNPGEHLNLGRGYRSKLPQLSVSSAVAIDPITNVLNGTDFATLVSTYLPAYGVLNLSSGQITVEIDWQEGSYDGDVEGTYNLVGTPINLPQNVSNGNNIQFEVEVGVQAGGIERTVLISLKGTGTSPYVGTGNWNHVAQSFATGAQTIRGDNNDDVLASLRDTDGNLTGYGVSIGTQLQGSDTIGMNSAGAYPANAIRAGWTNPGSADTVRTFSITGLNNSLSYTFTILMSKDSGVTGDGITTVTISGASGGGSVSDFEAKGNINTTHTLPAVVPNAGVVNIAVTKRGVTSVINVVQIDWTE